MNADFCLYLNLLIFLGFVSSGTNFVYNGFLEADLSLDGASHLRPNGILSLTNDSVKLIGHALYPSPIRFKRSRINQVVVTFSTNFVFSMVPKYPSLGGHGLAFVLLSTRAPSGCLPNQYLGLPNSTRDGSTRLLAVEFDAVQNLELMDINDNHVGIDISSLISNVSEPAAYYYSATNNISNHLVFFKSGNPVHAWIEYNSQEKLMNITISPLGIPKSSRPLISFPVDLSMVLNEYMYIGFSASTGLLAAAHNIHGWSFRIGGKAADLDPLRLPSPATKSRRQPEVLRRKGLALGVILVILVISGSTGLVLYRIRNKEEVLEEWEVEYGAHRFKYSDIFSATRGFREKNLIGAGGFGRVYKGVIPRTGLEVAIKRISHDSKQGMKEFVAEITSMGRLRHRNLVQLHGWCRKQDELILVYDYILNGSLDKILYHHDERQKKKILTWEQRYKILIGVSQALLYLHEECDQRVVHRDVKPSNVLIDEELNPRLGDFGLARIYRHGNNPETTHIVGTLGYLAPEMTRIGKASTSTDVYAYGVMMLEVVTGRRPIEPQRDAAEVVLVDWVREAHEQGEILRVIDPTLDDDEYDPDEAKLVLSLGLLCAHPHPDYRPDMRRVVQYLLKDANLPHLPPHLHLQVSADTFTHDA